MTINSSANRISTEETLAINAPRMHLHLGKDILIKNGIVSETDSFEHSLGAIQSFLKNNLTKHPSRDFRISVQRSDKEGVTVSLWWESQNVYIDNALQQHYTKYSPTIVLDDKMSKEQVMQVFDTIKGGIAASHPDRAKYGYFIQAQEETAFVLLGIKKALKTVVTDAELLQNNYARSKVRGEGEPTQMVSQQVSNNTSLLAGQHDVRGEDTQEDQEKKREVQKHLQKSPVASFSNVLEEIEEEIKNPSVNATFHESGIKEKRFLGFVVSMAAFIRKQGSVAESLWKFYANKFVDMVRNFFGASIFKDSESAVALKKLWKRIQSTAEKLASSSVLDRMQRVIKGREKAPEVPTFEERAQAIKSRMTQSNDKKVVPTSEPRSFQERADLVKKQMQERVQKEQKSQVQQSTVVQNSVYTTPHAEYPTYAPVRPKSFWEKTKETVSGTVKKWFGK